MKIQGKNPERCYLSRFFLTPYLKMIESVMIITKISHSAFSVIQKIISFITSFVLNFHLTSLWRQAAKGAYPLNYYSKHSLILQKIKQAVLSAIAAHTAIIAGGISWNIVQHRYKNYQPNKIKPKQCKVLNFIKQGIIQIQGKVPAKFEIPVEISLSTL